jgi:hypothetical protein
MIPLSSALSSSSDRFFEYTGHAARLRHRFCRRHRILAVAPLFGRGHAGLSEYNKSQAYELT